MQTSRFVELRCLDCRTVHPTDSHSVCAKCGGILSGVYNLSEKLSTNSELRGIWRYGGFFPPVSEIVTLGEGSTPLVKTPRFSKSIGGKVYCKIEGTNPTGSFKDRIASLGLSLAKSGGKKGVFTASSGNAAAAIAAYSAHAGLGCLILVREDSTLSKIAQMRAYGPKILRVRNLFKTRHELDRALAKTQSALRDWLNHFIWAPYNPLLLDALKTIAYELALDDRIAPDYLFVPTAGGDLLYAVYKGYRELLEMSVIEKMPKLVAVQGKGADPLVRSFEQHRPHVDEIKPPARTIAGALRVTFGADHSLRAIRESGGFAISVPDSQILKAQRKIAALEGIFCEVSSATTLAAIDLALSQKKIGRDETAVALLTGSGFKDYSVFSRQKLPPLASIEAIPKAIKKI
jgi:threonine synthase